MRACQMYESNEESEMNCNTSGSANYSFKNYLFNSSICSLGKRNTELRLLLPLPEISWLKVDCDVFIWYWG